MGIHLFDFTLWLTLVHSGSLSGPQRHPLYIAEAPPSGHENLSRQWQIQHTAESKWQIQHTTTITFTQPLDLWLLQENPSTLNTSGWLIVWSQIGSLWPACLPPWPKHEQIHFSFALSPAPPAPSLLPSRLLPVTRMSGRRSSHPAPTCAQLAPSSTRTSSVQIFSCSLKAEKHKYQVLAGQFNPVMSCIRKS